MPDELIPQNGQAVEAPVEQTPAESYVLRDYFRSKGHEVPDDATDTMLDERIGGWASAAERAAKFADIPDDADPKELLQYADLGRQYAPYQSQFDQFRQSLQQPKPPEAPAQPAQPSGPDETALRLARQVCKHNAESGLWEPSHPMYAESARILNDVAQKTRLAVEQFGMDPDGFLKPRFEPINNELKTVKEQLAEFQAMREEWQQYRDQQVQQQFLHPKEAEYVKARAADGSVAELTLKGKAFSDAYESAPESLNLQQRLEWAAAKADQWAMAQPKDAPKKPGLNFGAKPASAQPATEPAKPAENGDDKRKRFVDEGRQRGDDGRFLPASDRAATIAAAARRREPQGREMTPADLYQAALASR